MLKMANARYQLGKWLQHVALNGLYGLHCLLLRRRTGLSWASQPGRAPQLSASQNVNTLQSLQTCVHVFLHVWHCNASADVHNHHPGRSYAVLFFELHQAVCLGTTLAQ